MFSHQLYLLSIDQIIPIKNDFPPNFLPIILSSILVVHIYDH